MTSDKIVSHTELGIDSQNTDLLYITKSFIKQQLNNWDLPAKNYRGLQDVQIKNIDFEDFTIKVQFNPHRIKSSAAKVDKTSIANRKCFLCYTNLPDQQRMLDYKNEYMILVNPFPIFSEHLTIPHYHHIRQRIDGNFLRFLDLSYDLQDFVVFYNGPWCGASAPDHLHFQAGNKNFMPVEDDYERFKPYYDTIYENSDISVTGMKNYLRKFIALESGDRNALHKAFAVVFDYLQNLSYEDEEPMMNILASYEKDKWRIIIFPRNKHRPDQYYSEGTDELLLSPGAVDFGGVLITPREEDFNKLDQDFVADIFNQVSVSDEQYKEMIESLKRSFQDW